MIYLNSPFRCTAGMLMGKQSSIHSEQFTRQPHELITNCNPLLSTSKDNLQLQKGGV